MVITIGPELETVLNKAAGLRGVDPQTLAISALKEKFSGTSTIEPQDEWERRLLALALDCGVALPDSALGRDALYD
jgi:hypothetical protein